MRLRSYDIGSIEVDGVPVFHTRKPVDPDRLMAILMFRVGLGDEQLTATGITHLVQHLVMLGVRSSGNNDPHPNASVDLLTTQFHTAGRADDVVEFLRDVCRSIGALDLSRLELGKQAISAEANQRRHSVLGEQSGWRYGVAGPGLLQWQDVAVPQLAAGPVAAWAVENLTAGNAALVLSGPPPPGLELPLRPGPRRGVPAWPQVRPTPGWLSPLQVGGAAVSSVIDRSTAATAYAAALAHRLRTEVRDYFGLSRELWVQYLPLGSEKMMIVGFADHAPFQQQRLASAFVTTFMSMAHRTVSPDESAAWRAEYPEGSDRAAALALAAARDTLLGSEVIEDDELRRRVDAVTADDILHVAAEACRHALYAVPTSAGFVGNGVPQVPPSGASAIGRPTNPWHVWWAHDFQSDRGRLYVSDAGVGLFRHNRHTLSVHWRSCAALLRWADGGRALVTRDGAVLPIEPTMWARGAKLSALVDERIPAARHISLPAREPASIPRPTHNYRRWQRYAEASR